MYKILGHLSYMHASPDRGLLKPILDYYWYKRIPVGPIIIIPVGPVMVQYRFKQNARWVIESVIDL